MAADPTPDEERTRTGRPGRPHLAALASPLAARRARGVLHTGAHRRSVATGPSQRTAATESPHPVTGGGGRRRRLSLRSSPGRTSRLPRTGSRSPGPPYSRCHSTHVRARGVGLSVNDGKSGREPPPSPRGEGEGEQEPPVRRPRHTQKGGVAFHVKRDPTQARLRQRRQAWRLPQCAAMTSSHARPAAPAAASSSTAAPNARSPAASAASEASTTPRSAARP